MERSAHGSLGKLDAFHRDMLQEHFENPVPVKQ
jgi:hypothetical protein